MYKYFNLLAILTVPFMVLETVSDPTFAENIENQDASKVDAVSNLKVGVKISTNESTKENQSLPLMVGDLRFADF
ncbi:MAG: hypothetical protein WCP16_23475 [Pseudanabaena sp. ELA645]